MSKYSKEILFRNKKTIPWMLVLSFIVLLPNILFTCYGNVIAEASPVKIIIYWMISVFLFLIPSLFFKMRTFFLFHGIFVIAAPLEIAHIYLNRMPVTTAFLLSIFDTDWNESTEVLSSLKIPIFLLLIFWGGYFYIAFKKIKNVFLFRSLKVRMYCLGGSLFIFLLVYSYCFSSEYYIKTNKKDVFDSTNKYFLMKSHVIYPYNLLITTYKVYATKKEIKDGREKIKDFRFYARKENPISEKEVYVYVIGETGRYDSFSSNG